MNIVRMLSPVLIAGCLMFCGCPNAHRAMLTTDMEHGLKTGPEALDDLQAGLLREAEHITAEIQGPLREEIAAYVSRQVLEIGALAWHSRDFTEKQLQEAAGLPDKIAQYLSNAVWDAYGQMVEQLHRYGYRNTELDMPQLHTAYRRYLAYHRENAAAFVQAFKRYDEINSQMIDDLSLDITNFIAWQGRNAQELSGAGQRYMERLSSDYDEVMNTTARMFDYNLSTRPQELKETLFRSVRYNTGEVVEQLNRSVGTYFWNELDVTPLSKELYCFANRNIDETRRVLEATSNYFAINAVHTRELTREVHRFFEWRTKQWAQMRNELDRYLSQNVENFERFAQSPLRYLEKQVEEMELLKKAIPAYFLFNVGQSEGLGLALRRYFEGNIGE